MGLENPLHIAVLVVLVLLVFGAKRLPEIGRSLGTGMREFKDSVTGASSEPAPQPPALSQATQQPQPPAQSAAPTPEQVPAEPTRQ